MRGGKVIASGTYGCILKPAMPCKGTTERPKDTVSKLMIKHNAETEMKEIKKVNTLVQQIPNHKDFYLVSGVKMCDPKKLDKEDLTDFNKKCGAITRKNIRESRVNLPFYLNKLKILQLPDGGEDISDYFYSKKIKPELFVVINKALIHLLTGGIVPLVNHGILHMDLKSANIVYSKATGFAKIIDWGLSTTISGNTIPYNVRGFPVMYNQPFSTLIFHKIVQTIFDQILKYSETQKKIKNFYGQNIVDYLLPIVSNSFFDLVFHDESSVNTYVGSLGHIEYLASVFKKILNMNLTNISPNLESSIKKSPFHTVGRIVSDQLTLTYLLYSYVPSKRNFGNFREREFFNNVYKQNCDIQGFISSYYDLMTNENIPKMVRVKTYSIINKYCFDISSAVTKINIQELISMLRELNKEFLPTHVSTPILAAPGAPTTIQPESRKDLGAFTWDITRRCPNGSRRDKKTRKCVKIDAKQIKHRATKKRKRCPNGTRKNIKTGLCEKKK